MSRRGSMHEQLLGPVLDLDEWRQRRHERRPREAESLPAAYLALRAEQQRTRIALLLRATEVSA